MNTSESGNEKKHPDIKIATHNVKQIFYIGIHCFSGSGTLEQKEEKKKKINEANPSPCFRAFPCRLCVCTPFKNVELEIWIQCHGRLCCEIRYVLKNLFDNFVSSCFSIDFVNLLSTAGLSIVVVLLP